MRKYISIKIPETCSQEWNVMEERSAGRHCNSCNKTVIDFTLMTDTQLAGFFKKNTTDICGRFYEDQLNKQIILPKKELPWLKYFFTITLPAFLFSQKSLAQRTLIKDRFVLERKEFKSEEILCNTEKIVKNKTDSIVELEAVTVKAVPLNTYTRIVAGATVSGKSYRIVNKKESVAKKDNKLFNIFPNPVSQNSKLNIFWKQSISSNQLIEIFDANGKLIQKEMLAISFKTKNAVVWLKKIGAGDYIIRISDTKTQLQFSEVFIVL
jgi:hypothetical protein